MPRTKDLGIYSRIDERLKLIDESVHPASAWYREDVAALRDIADAAAYLLTFVPARGATIKAGYGNARRQLWDALYAERRP